jgi:hypothetical protein
VIAVIAAQILKSSIEGHVPAELRADTARLLRQALQGGPAAVICMLALAAIYKFPHKYTPLVPVVVGAIAGQFIFIDSVE